MLAQLLQQAEEISSHAIADSSKLSYRKSINVYAKVMASIGEEAFPITLEKMMGFITNQYNEKRQCSTLMNYIGGLSNYFKENSLENLTQHMRFKVFKSGIRRQLKSGIFPYQKEPFNSDWFQNILHFFPVSMSDNARFMLLISLCWHCFLRVSEAMQLKKEDLNFDSEKLSVFIRSSKTDQLGEGETCYVYPSNAASNPIHYLEVLNFLNTGENISGMSIQALRSHLKFVLNSIGIAYVDSYSFHSFRRGAAFLASEKGVQDCVIKKHGRWKSDAYLRYVRVEAARAGNEITKALE